jgi:hypothetical protein
MRLAHFCQCLAFLSKRFLKGLTSNSVSGLTARVSGGIFVSYQLGSANWLMVAAKRGAELAVDFTLTRGWGLQL